MMDSKLRSILTLALRPETTAGEVAAATAAARRLVARSGLDTLLDVPVKEGNTYRNSNKYTQSVLFTFRHEWYNYVASDMLDHACKLQVSVFPRTIENVDELLKMRIEICGNPLNVEKYIIALGNLRDYIIQQDRYKSTQQQSKLTGWFGKLKEFVS